MNHEYQPNPNREGRCLDCGHPQDKHGPDAICDSCSNTGVLNDWILGNKQALLCRDCIEREKQANLNEQELINKALEHQTPEKQEARLLEYKTISAKYDAFIKDVRKIDEQVHLSTDLFTAKTVAITEIRAAIWADESISADDKYFELARVCKERILHFKNVIFDLDKLKIEAYSEQKSWHIQLNDLANKLRTDQREQLRISDITYDVKSPKVVTPRAIKNSPKKATKEELRKASLDINFPEHTIQLVMTSKNWTLEQACNHLRRGIKEGLSIVRPPEPIIEVVEPEIVDMDAVPEIEDIT